MLTVYRSGVNVPGIRMVDASEGILGIEWIEGSSVKHLLPSGAAEDVDGDEAVPTGLHAYTLEDFGISAGMNFSVLYGSGYADLG